MIVRRRGGRFSQIKGSWASSWQSEPRLKFFFWPDLADDSGVTTGRKTRCVTGACLVCDCGSCSGEKSMGIWARQADFNGRLSN